MVDAPQPPAPPSSPDADGSAAGAAAAAATARAAEVSAATPASAEPAAAPTAAPAASPRASTNLSAALLPLLRAVLARHAAQAGQPRPERTRPALPDPTERSQAWQALQTSLGQAPWRHDYFQVLRWVEALHPDRPRLGQALRPRDEPLRVGQDPELNFAPATLNSFGRLTQATPYYAGVYVRLPPLRGARPAERAGERPGDPAGVARTDVAQAAAAASAEQAVNPGTDPHTEAEARTQTQARPDRVAGPATSGTTASNPAPETRVAAGADPMPSGAHGPTAGHGGEWLPPPRLGQRAFGLFGPMGPLPLHLTELMRERLRHVGDAAPLAFADIFQHRAGLLFYRAWAQAQPVCHVDRPGDDGFGRWVGALAGLGQPELLGRDRVADHAKRLHAGALARGPRNAEGLMHIVRQYFKVPVRLEPYVGHWLELDPAQRLTLKPPPGGASAGRRLGRTQVGAGSTSGLGRSAPPVGGVVRPGLLGVSAAAGSRVWDRQSRFRLHLGPLALAQYEQFLPGQPALLALRDWLRHYTGLGLSCEVRLILRGAEVPEARLARVGATPGATGAAGVRLGRTCWLGGRRSAGSAHPPVDRGDLAFLVEPAT
jgi:type VI secretion system protein ImpH